MMATGHYGDSGWLCVKPSQEEFEKNKAVVEARNEADSEMAVDNPTERARNMSIQDYKKNRPHIMVDLETMSSDSNAAIVSIGAVRFNFEDVETQPHLDYQGGFDHFQASVDLQSCMDLGLKVSGDTIYWWLSQSEEARSAILKNPVMRLQAVLEQFSNWVGNRYDIQGVWCHATFDAPILDSAYKSIGRKIPWPYTKIYDLRTINFLYPPKEGLYSETWAALEKEGHVKHNSLSDAIAQAIILKEQLRGKMNSLEKLTAADHIVEIKQADQSTFVDIMKGKVIGN